MIPLCVNAVSPQIDHSDEAAAADLFGPDEWGTEGDGHEPAVASGDAVDGGEIRMDALPTLASRNPLHKLPWV